MGKNSSFENEVYLITRFIMKSWYSVLGFVITLWNPFLVFLEVEFGTRLLWSFLFTVVARVIDEIAYQFAKGEYYTNRASGFLHSSINSFRHWRTRGVFSIVAFGVLNGVTYFLYACIWIYQWIEALFQ